MFNSMKNINGRRLNQVDNKMLFPMITWLSGEVSNLKFLSNFTTKFFYLQPDIAKSFLAYNINPKLFIKYPKGKKFKQEEFDIVVNIFKKYFHYGMSDIESSKQLIYNLLNNKNKLEQLANDIGMDNKLRKKLKLTQQKINKKELVFNKNASLMDF